MKSLLSAVLELVSPEQQQQQQEAPLEFDIEMQAEQQHVPYVERSWSYYVSNYGMHPTRVGDLLLGIALEDEHFQWWVPLDHPIAEILLHNQIEPHRRSEAGTLLCYVKSDISLGQKSLAAILSDKALLEEGAIEELHLERDL